MDKDQFAQAVAATLSLLIAATGDCAAERKPHDPTEVAHLNWMLWQARDFHDVSKVEKANRWLGYVQGVMAARNFATLEQLKRANMPTGETFSAERV